MRALPLWVLAGGFIGLACEPFDDDVPEAPKIEEPRTDPAREQTEELLEQQRYEDDARQAPTPGRFERMIREREESEYGIQRASWTGHPLAGRVVLAQATDTENPLEPDRPAPFNPEELRFDPPPSPPLQRDELDLGGFVDPGDAYGPSKDPPLAADPIRVRKNFGPEIAESEQGF